MKTLKIIAATLIVAGALFWLNHSLHPQPLDRQSLPFFGVGEVLANEAARVAHDKGRVVLVNLPMDSVNSQSQLQGFQETLAGHHHLTLVATKNIDLHDTTMGKINVAQLTAIINDYSNADVIVIFPPLTSLSDAQLQTLPKPAPKLIVMDWSMGDLNLAANAGLVAAAVSTRQLTSLPSDHPRTPRQWFDRYYDLVPLTKDN